MMLLQLKHCLPFSSMLVVPIIGLEVGKTLQNNSDNEDAAGDSRKMSSLPK